MVKLAVPVQLGRLMTTCLLDWATQPEAGFSLTVYVPGASPLVVTESAVWPAAIVIDFVVV